MTEEIPLQGRRRPVLPLVERLFERGILRVEDRVVDLGCGSFPHIAVNLAANGFRGLYFGVDWNPKALAAGQRRWEALGCLPGFATEWFNQDAWDLAPQLFQDSLVLCHGLLPQFLEGGRRIIPTTDQEISGVIHRLFASGARELVLFLHPALAQQVVEVVAPSPDLRASILKNTWSGGLPPEPCGNAISVQGAVMDMCPLQPSKRTRSHGNSN